jgi:hypothetical protein
MSMAEQQGTPITTEELLQCIGELFVQSKVLQKLLAFQSQQLIQAQPQANGKVETLDPVS